MVTESPSKKDALDRAFHHYSAGKYEEAFVEFEEVKGGDEELDEIADYHMAWMLKTGYGVQKNISRARELLEGIRNYQKEECTWGLGTIAETEGEFDKAVVLYKEAVQGSYLPAIYSLGRCYAEGVGIRKDFQSSRMYLEQAVEGGHIFAMRKLGGMMLRGCFGNLLRLKGIGLIVMALMKMVPLLLRHPHDDRLRTF